MPDYDKKPEPLGIPLKETVVKEYANGTKETIQVKTTISDPNNPSTTTVIYQESDGWCENPWKLHPPFRVTKKANGDVTEKGTLLCDDCLEHNDKLIKQKAKWRFPYIFDPKTY